MAGLLITGTITQIYLMYIQSQYWQSAVDRFTLASKVTMFVGGSSLKCNRTVYTVIVTLNTLIEHTYNTKCTVLTGIIPPESALPRHSTSGLTSS